MCKTFAGNGRFLIRERNWPRPTIVAAWSEQAPMPQIGQCDERSQQKQLRSSYYARSQFGQIPKQNVNKAYCYVPQAQNTPVPPYQRMRENQVTKVGLPLSSERAGQRIAPKMSSARSPSAHITLYSPPSSNTIIGGRGKKEPAELDHQRCLCCDKAQNLGQ